MKVKEAAAKKTNVLKMWKTCSNGCFNSIGESYKTHDENSPLPYLAHSLNISEDINI